MEHPADFKTVDRDGKPTAVLTGDWTATGLQGTELRLEDDVQEGRILGIDAAGVGRCDTSGAYAMLDACRNRFDWRDIEASADIHRLLELVDHALQAEPTPIIRRRP